LTENDKVAAAGIDGSNHQTACAPLMAAAATAKALVNTAPTTVDGLHALEQHLRSGYGANVRWLIERPIHVDGAYMGISTGGEARIDYLISKHTERLAG
jgi:hypothetical protein